MLRMFCLRSFLAFLEKKTLDFLMLTFWPEWWLKLVRVSIMVVLLEVVSLAKRRRTSTKKGRRF